MHVATVTSRQVDKAGRLREYVGEPPPGAAGGDWPD